MIGAKLQINRTAATRAASVFLITAVCIFGIEWGRIAGTFVPIPFLLLYATVVLAGGVGGLLAGAPSGALAAAYVLYAASVGFGPQSLTGGQLQVLLGAGLYFGTGVLLGLVRSQRDKFARAIRQHRSDLESRISERNADLEKSREALSAREEIFRQMADSISEVFWMADPAESRVVYVSPAYEQIWQRSRQSLYDNLFSFLDAIHPDDRQRMATLIGNRNQSYDEEYRVQRPDGTERWVRDRAFPVRDGAGNVYRVTGIAEDVTDRKEAANRLLQAGERLRLATEAAGIGIWDCDVATGALVRNERMHEIYGIRQSAFVAHIESWKQAIHPDDRERVVRDEEIAVDDGTHEYIPEYRIVRPDGEVRYIDGYGQVLRDAAGNAVRITGVNLDITERVELERQLQHSQKMEVVGQLTGGIAHDFNNLLAAILGNLELMKSDLDPESPLQKSLDTALGATLRGADLTQRLLAFSRLQPLNADRVNINALMPGMTELMRRTLGEPVEIETVLASGLWETMVDTGQFENALLNLAINARDAMPGGGKLTIDTANARIDREYAASHDEVTPGQYVMVSVTDSGTGMSPEVVERAFEPFFTTKDVGRGSGLGLSMIYGFVKQSGGHIKIYSEPGHGTTVKIYLPRAAANGRKERVVPAATTSMPGGSETILVVEDDADVRNFLITALGTLGYRVIEAEDGPAALALLDDFDHLDMVLTDVIMPNGMSGPQVAEAVSSRFPGVKILYSSGYTENASVHQGKLAEEAELLSKPYTRATLAQNVRRVLDTPEQ